jgi:hypothetical protein
VSRDYDLSRADRAELAPVERAERRRSTTELLEELRRDTERSLRRQPARQRPKTMAEAGGGTTSRTGDRPARPGGQPCPVAGCADPACLQRRQRQPAKGASR